MLEDVKKDLMIVVQKLDLENVITTCDTLESYVGFLRSMEKIPVFQVNDQPEKEEIGQEEKQGEMKIAHEESNQAEGQKEQHQPQLTTYLFDRKLKGGIIEGLGSIGTGYFVPEMIVRKIGLEHGDRVRVFNERPFDGDTRYDIEIVEKGTDSNIRSNRVEVKFCIVDKDRDGFFIHERVGGESISLNGKPHTFVIKKSDAVDLNLSKEDVVDIAYYSNNPDLTMRVIWRHDITEIERVEKQQPHKQQQKKNDEKEEPREKESIESINKDLFKGKHIIVVGATPKEANYKAYTDQLEATLEVMSGWEEKSRLRSRIRRSDAVVIVTAHLGHRGSIMSVELCKKAKVPFEIVDTMGNEAFLRAAEMALTKRIEV